MKPKTPNNEDIFWKICSKNAKDVKKWPKWKQQIEISAETASTGNFIRK